MQRPFSTVTALALGLAVALPSPSRAQPAGDAPKGLDRIQHIIVVYLENHSFDNLFGTFPRANGRAKVGDAERQVDLDGKPYAKLPPVIDTGKKPPEPDPRFPANLPNRPFLIDKYVKQDQKVPDLVHRYYQEIGQIDGGKMDK